MHIALFLALLHPGNAASKKDLLHTHKFMQIHKYLTWYKIHKYLRYAYSVIRDSESKVTCLSWGAKRLHSAPSLLVISGKGRSGCNARICSRLSFRKRTYPVTGALGPLGKTFFLFLPLGQPRFFTGCALSELLLWTGCICEAENE